MKAEEESDQRKTLRSRKTPVALWSVQRPADRLPRDSILSLLASTAEASVGKQAQVGGASGPRTIGGRGRRASKHRWAGPAAREALVGGPRKPQEDSWRWGTSAAACSVGVS